MSHYSFRAPSHLTSQRAHSYSFFYVSCYNLCVFMVRHSLIDSSALSVIYLITVLYLLEAERAGREGATGGRLRGEHTFRTMKALGITGGGRAGEQGAGGHRTGGE